MSENPFENEILKLKWLLLNGFIDPQQVKFFSQLYNIDPDSVYEPKIIVARPSQFNRIMKEQGDLAGIADPYSRIFPVVSLLSLEKAINSLADLKVPWKTFKVIVDNDYGNAPPVAFKLLLELADILNKHGYNVSVQLPQSVEIAKKYYNLNFDNVNLTDDLKKVICHLLKRLRERVVCDDSNWANYDLWGGKNKEKLDMERIKKIAIDMGLPIIIVKYIVSARNNKSLLEKYKKSFNLDDDTVAGIINRYKYNTTETDSMFA